MDFVKSEMVLCKIYVKVAVPAGDCLHLSYTDSTGLDGKSLARAVCIALPLTHSSTYIHGGGGLDEPSARILVAAGAGKPTLKLH